MDAKKDCKTSLVDPFEARSPAGRGPSLKTGSRIHMAIAVDPDEHRHRRSPSPLDWGKTSSGF